MDDKEFGLIKEGLAEVYFHKSDENVIPSKSMKVFYNKKMILNRDVSNLAINAFNEIYHPKNLIIVDSMAASGISSFRMLKECSNIKKIYINDLNPLAVDLIKKNHILNKLDNHKYQIEISRKEANYLFSEINNNIAINSDDDIEKPNIISIDPFGTPNIYLDSAFKTIRKTDGLICITATDTAVLFGVKPKACMRKYMSKPLHNDYCKEIGARILIHFISRIANINNLGIEPLILLSSSHFLRFFGLTYKNKKKISQNFKNYGYIIHCRKCGYRAIININTLECYKSCPNCRLNDNIDYAGPLWIGEMYNEFFLKTLQEMNQQKSYFTKKKVEKILKYILQEIGMPISYYNLHKMSKNLKLKTLPKMDAIIEKIKEKGFKASRTHFDFTSFKTTMNIETLEELLFEITQ